MHNRMISIFITILSVIAFCVPAFAGKYVNWNDDGTVTTVYKSSPTWHDIIFGGNVGAPRYSHDRAYCIIKGEWSMKEGVLSELIALGASKSYPNFSVLTKSEAQTLAASSTFTGE